MILLVVEIYCVSNEWDKPKGESISVTLPRPDGRCEYFPEMLHLKTQRLHVGFLLSITCSQNSLVSEA